MFMHFRRVHRQAFSITVLELSHGVVVRSTSVSGRMARCTAKELTHGMVDSTLVSTKITKPMAKEL